MAVQLYRRAVRLQKNHVSPVAKGVADDIAQLHKGGSSRLHKGRGYQNADLNDKKGNQWQAVGFFAEVCSDSNANDNNITGC